MKRTVLADMIDTIRAYAEHLPEASPTHSDKFAVRVGPMTVRFEPNRPAAEAILSRLLAAKPYRVRVPKELAPRPYSCVGGPFAGSTIWLTRGVPQTMVFTVAGQRGRYVADCNHVLWREVTS